MSGTGRPRSKNKTGSSQRPRSKSRSRKVHRDVQSLSVPSLKTSNLVRPKNATLRPRSTLVRTRSVAEELSVISLDFAHRSSNRLPTRPQSAKVLTSNQRSQPLPDLIANIEGHLSDESFTPRPPATDRPHSARPPRMEQPLNSARPPRPVHVPKRFPFSQLPFDMKLKVLSFLTDIQKGRAMLVSKEWFQLMKTPCLWSVVDFTSLPLCFDNHYCVQHCYEKYCLRVKAFFDFLNKIRPPIKRFCFEYDLADNWLNALEDFLVNSNTKRLEFAHINWKETPIRPFWNYNLCTPETSGEAFSQRSKFRQGMFVQFFDLFTQVAPSLKQLVLPFDWSEATVEMMKRFKHLETLVIEKYFVFQNIRQSALDGLMRNTPKLERLLLEIWAPAGNNLTLYHIQSLSIQYLDISQCRGFYLKAIDMPKLKIFKTTRRPWNGPVTSADSVNMPCIYSILFKGAPNLVHLNNLQLEPNWRSCLYKELDEHLKAICSCKRHKSGWAM